jgi:hypothetical protein
VSYQLVGRGKGREARRRALGWVGLGWCPTGTAGSLEQEAKGASACAVRCGGARAEDWGIGLWRWGRDAEPAGRGRGRRRGVARDGGRGGGLDYWSTVLDQAAARSPATLVRSVTSGRRVSCRHCVIYIYKVND